MKLVIELLQKELERQNLLINSNKVAIMDMYGVTIEYLYPDMVQLRDQIEEAITLLKTHSK